MKAAVVELASGRWFRSVAVTPDEVVLELVHVANEDNRMRVRLPADWRSLDEARMREYARRPEIRLWCDEDGIHWRVSAVGPGTSFPYPLLERYVVFDSQRAWAGIVRFEEALELGDLTDLELRGLRDRVSDFGGRRRAYRGPAATQLTQP